MRLTPGGSPIPWRAIARVCTDADARGELTRALQARFPGRRLTFHSSGREAMRIALSSLAERTGRSEIAIPAYGCFSIPASVVAAGLRVRLVDVDERGQLARESIERLPFERVAAIVVGNLFGLPEPIAGIVTKAHAAGAAVVDDAAQALGATAPDGVVGGRGDIGILSFGRGKPISALGGGAAIWQSEFFTEDGREGLGEPRRIAALTRGIAYNVSRQPFVLGILATIPALEIGLTTFDPGFARGAMSGAAVSLAAALERELDRLNADRRERALALALRIHEQTEFVALLEAGGTRGVFPRLALRAPTPARRDRALAALARLGATAMYPTPMDRIGALALHRTDTEPCPGAEAFCARLLTLPTHAGLFPWRMDEVVKVLADI